jgi:hypothetical protein
VGLVIIPVDEESEDRKGIVFSFLNFLSSTARVRPRRKKNESMQGNLNFIVKLSYSIRGLICGLLLMLDLNGRV